MDESDFGITADMKPPSLADMTPKGRKTYLPNLDGGTVVKSRAKNDPLVDFGKTLDKYEKITQAPVPVINKNPSNEAVNYLDSSRELTAADFGIDENTINPMDFIQKKIEKVDIAPSLSFTPVKVLEKENVIPKSHHTRQDLHFLTPVKTMRVFSEDFIRNTPNKNDSLNLRDITIGINDN